MTFQSPFKISAPCLSAKDTSGKKDGGDGNNNKKRKDDLFTPNALEMDNYFRVGCSVAALLLFFYDREFHGQTARGDTFLDSDNCRPAPLSDMWLNILLKQRSANLSITLTTILIYQEARMSALGGIPPFR
jgi:hypothetical protein